MLQTTLLRIAAPLLALVRVDGTPTNSHCKCTPGDTCWPSSVEWQRLNSSLSGKLIATKPIAFSCYPGADFDDAACDGVNAAWSSAMWMSEQSIGLDFPLNITCPPISAAARSTVTADQCTIGSNPVYAVNATEIDDIVAAVRFAKAKNLRLVIKTTGHDILGRSDGYGSLVIWLRYFRNGITFNPSYSSTTGCKAIDWDRSAMKVAGGYMWGDVYAQAAANNVVIVGGGTTTVSSIGGWMQGGGHGPASSHFGLGADQILEAEVILANGEVVTTNACQNQDLFFAIRGGGPGTYGIVVSATLKTYPQVNATIQRLLITPLDASRDRLRDAIATIYGEYPNLVESGFSGYPNWQSGAHQQFYAHSLFMLNTTKEYVQAKGQILLDKLSQFSDTLNITSSYVSYPDYWSFYDNLSNHDLPIGYMGAIGSRMLDSESLQDFAAIRATVDVLAGQPSEGVNNAVSLVSGGQVWAAKSQKSAVNPVWRTTVAIHSCSRPIVGKTAQEWQEIHDDITYTKTAALTALAPQTGVYMNEADRFDPSWKVNFYGSNYQKLYRIKSRYDPTSLFYCPTCVGSDDWRSDSTGRLCAV
ncbi:hypothetical protein GGR57DRAFT_510512 [Xylariaceae sp. FL1272]|nr:hypothetical protein GGR57DRAFT_510512 [Xylariaceae sp. FL1272]